MVLKINGLTLALGEREEVLPARIAAILGLSEGAIAELRVIRRMDQLEALGQELQPDGRLAGPGRA